MPARIRPDRPATTPLLPVTIQPGRAAEMARVLALPAVKDTALAVDKRALDI